MEEPQNSRSRRTRAAVLAAARRRIEREGFPGLTMAAVAADAGVTRRALYLHFASRAELVTALFEHVNDEEDLQHSVQSVWSAPDSVTALDEWAHHLARFQPRVAAVLRANDAVRRSDEDAERLWQLVMRDWLAGCRRLARWLEREGVLAPPWTAASAGEMLWALMSYDVVDRLVLDRGWSQRRLGEHLGTLLRRTFVQG